MWWIIGIIALIIIVTLDDSGMLGVVVAIGVAIGAFFLLDWIFDVDWLIKLVKIGGGAIVVIVAGALIIGIFGD